MSEAALGRNFDEVLDNARTWVGEARPRHGSLYVDGDRRAGKTRLLEELLRNSEGTILLDAAGMTAERLAHRLMESLGVPYGAPCDLLDLMEALEDESPDAVVLVANAQWAGTTRTTSEPRRVVSPVVGTLGSAFRRTGVRFVVEVDASVVRLHEGAHRVALHVGDGGSGSVTAGLPHRKALAVKALAMSEPRRVGLDEWRFLCACAGEGFDTAELHDLARDLPFLVVDGRRGPSVGFRGESVAQGIRRQVPAEDCRAFHRAVVRHLTDRHGGEPLTAYARRALAAHAAAGGCFEELLADPRALTLCEHTALVEALGAAFPRGIPGGTLAAELHYLDKLGPAPSSHAEWVSLLHHSAVCRGDVERARALEDAAGELPWRTTWANWRPGGAPRAPRVWTGRITHMRAVPGTGCVVSTNEDGEELVWDVSTGEPVRGGSRRAAAPADAPPPAWRAERTLGEVRLERTDDPGTACTVQAPGPSTSRPSGTWSWWAGPWGCTP